MKRVAVLLFAPLLLAPVRYQSGAESILLAPAQGPASGSYALPAAVGLTSPTVITLSPTVLPGVGGGGVSSATARVSGTGVTPTLAVTATAPVRVVVVVAPEVLMPSTTAIICNRALEMVGELSILSYQQKRQQSTMDLTIASAIAAAEAAERRYPLLTASMESLGGLQAGTPQGGEIRTAMQMAQAACRGPLGGYRKPAPGSRIEVPRPD